MTNSLLRTIGKRAGAVLFCCAFAVVALAQQPFKGGIFSTAYDAGTNTATVEVRVKPDQAFTGSFISQIVFMLRAKEGYDATFGAVTSSPAQIAKGTGPNDCGTGGSFKYCYYVSDFAWAVDFASGAEVVVATLGITGTPNTIVELAVSAYAQSQLVDGTWYVEYGGTGNFLSDNDDPANEFYQHQAKLLEDSGLPVELGSFTASTDAGAIRLDWATDSEQNNAGFHVERSITGQRYEQIAFIEGAGTSLQRRVYSYVDAFTPANVSKVYYRLQQVDFDGRTEFSPIVEVAPPTPNKFRVDGAYPNPFNGMTQITYELPDQQYVSLRVFDALGREVKSLVSENQQAGRYSVRFDAAGLPSGIYMYRVEAGQYLGVGSILMVK